MEHHDVILPDANEKKALSDILYLAAKWAWYTILLQVLNHAFRKLSHDVDTDSAVFKNHKTNYNFPKECRDLDEIHASWKRNRKEDVVQTLSLWTELKKVVFKL